MRVNYWQMSTIVLGATLFGCLFGAQRLIPKVDAAPKDVLGSPNVAVSGYKTLSGSYVLYSDGRIVSIPADSSSLPTIVVENAQTVGEYLDPPSNFKMPVVDKRSKGSPNVAVGVIPSYKGTFILFSDGSLKRPKHDGAAQAPPGNPVTGFVTGLEKRAQGCRVTSWASGNPQQGATVVFDTPYDKTPSVTASGISGEGSVSVDHVTSTGFTIYVNYAATVTARAGYSWVVSPTDANL